MTDEELVDHLLTIDQMSVEDCFCQSTYFIKAADRIKQLTAERKDLVECNEQFFVDNRFLKKRVEKVEADFRKYEGAWMTAEGKLSDLEAKHSRLWKALLYYAEIDTRQYYGPYGERLDIGKVARAALRGEDYDR